MEVKDISYYENKYAEYLNNELLKNTNLLRRFNNAINKFKTDPEEYKMVNGMVLNAFIELLENSIRCGKLCQK